MPQRITIKASTSFVSAHVDLADHVFERSVYDRLTAIRDALLRHGCEMSLDVGKRTTTAKVRCAGLRAKSTYRSIEDFMVSEEARLAKMDAAARRLVPPAWT